jgi:plasmid stability protein
MRTLYLRNVPDEVVRRLELLAAQAGSSVAAVAVRELAEASLRADNPALLAALPDLGVPPEVLIDDVATGRAQR